MSQKTFDYFNTELCIVEKITSAQNLLGYINQINLSLVMNNRVSLDFSRQIEKSSTSQDQLPSVCDRVYFQLTGKTPQKQILDLDAHLEELKPQIQRLKAFSPFFNSTMLTQLLLSLTGSKSVSLENVQAAFNVVDTLYQRVDGDHLNLLSSLIIGQKSIKSDFQKAAEVLPLYFGVKYEAAELGSLGPILVKLQANINDFEKSYGIRFFTAIQQAVRVQTYEEPPHSDFLTHDELTQLKVFVQNNFNVATSHPLDFLTRYLIQVMGQQLIDSRTPYIKTVVMILNRDTIEFMNRIQAAFMTKQAVKREGDLRSVLVAKIESFKKESPFSIRELLHYLYEKVPQKLQIGECKLKIFILKAENEKIYQFLDALFDLKSILEPDQVEKAKQHQPLDLLLQVVQFTAEHLSAFLAEKMVKVDRKSSFLQLVLALSSYLQTELSLRLAGLKSSNFAALRKHVKEVSDLYPNTQNVYSQMFPVYQKYGGLRVNFEGVAPSVVQTPFSSFISQIFGCEILTISEFNSKIVPQFHENAPIFAQISDVSNLYAENLIQNPFPSLFGSFSFASTSMLPGLVDKSQQKLNIAHLLQIFEIQYQQEEIAYPDLILTKRSLGQLRTSLTNYGFKLQTDQQYLALWLYFPSIFSQLKADFYHNLCVEDTIIVHDCMMKYFLMMSNLEDVDPNIRNFGQKLTVNSLVMLLLGPQSIILQVDSEKDKVYQTLTAFNGLEAKLTSTLVDKLIYLDYQNTLTNVMSQVILQNKIDAKNITASQLKKLYFVMYSIYIQLKKIFGHKVTCIGDVFKNEEYLKRFQNICKNNVSKTLKPQQQVQGNKQIVETKPTNEEKMSQPSNINEVQLAKVENNENECSDQQEEMDSNIAGTTVQKDEAKHDTNEKEHTSEEVNEDLQIDQKIELQEQSDGAQSVVHDEQKINESE